MKPARLTAAFSLFGLMLLSCIFGAASLHFDFFPGPFLRDAFLGLDALQLRGHETGHVQRSNWTQLGITCDLTDKTCDGFTLYTTTQGTKAFLIDMRGNLVHSWSLPFSSVWREPAHIHSPPLPDEMVHWFRAEVFPNGDLIAIYQTSTDTPPGYGIAKLNKDSQLLWAYSNNVHHDLDIAEDGTIFTLVHQFQSERPPDLPTTPSPFLVDFVVQLSPEGKEVAKISLLEAFRGSAFAPCLFTQAKMVDAKKDQTSTTVLDNEGRPLSATGYDLLHTNSVKILSKRQASQFPQFKAGQILLSLRTIDTIAVLDVPSRSIVWATKGIWREQHDATFLDNGHLLIYDNAGSNIRSSRVLEFDPATLGYPWTYCNEDSAGFHALNRGMKQHLANGNTLIVNPNAGRIFEITRDRERVWEFDAPADPSNLPSESNIDFAITGIKRYSPDQLTFLKGNIHARP